MSIKPSSTPGRRWVAKTPERAGPVAAQSLGALTIPSGVLAGLQARAGALDGLRRGVEKESLRVRPDGRLSMRPHPPSLGSPLTHPQITTDFCEAQLELITGVHDTPEGCIAELSAIHRFVYQGLDDELLWAASMPCLVMEDDEIPVGRYGTSNIGRAKTVYRLGLGHRYGRLMQTISGIHYNFSLPEGFWPLYAELKGREPGRDFTTECYFALIRNFRRYSWLLIQLFGAAPAICRSFAHGGGHGLVGFDEGTLYLPGATSLRMGRLGYQSDAQSSLHISYNGLDSYAATMREALTHPYPPYEAIGVRHGDEYRQLNTALLQIENEFYGAIRPKRRIEPGERPLTALKRRGVEYVEVRCLDINPFLPVGIDAEQMRFLDAFLLWCLLAPSAADSPEESKAMQADQAAIVERGREPGLTLSGGDRDERAAAILEQCVLAAELIDRAQGGRRSSDAVREHRAHLQDPAQTPSAKVLEAMRSARQPFFRFGLNQSERHRRWFSERPLSSAERARHEQRAAQSFDEQRRIEAGDRESFENFLAAYLAPPE